MKMDEHNYQSYLLDYVDGELPEPEQQALLDYMAGHPEVAEQLELLQKTKLQAAEPLVFPNKSALYRTAGKPEKAQPGKPLRMAWKRWIAVAAALLLLLIASRLYLQEDTAGDRPASNDPSLAAAPQTQQQKPQGAWAENDSQRAQPQGMPLQEQKPSGQDMPATAPATSGAAPDLAVSPRQAQAAEQQVAETIGPKQKSQQAESIPDITVPPKEPEMPTASELAVAPSQPGPGGDKVVVNTPPETTIMEEPVAEGTETTRNQRTDALLARSLKKLRANKESLDSSLTDKVFAWHEKIKHPMKALNIKKISIGNVSFVFN